jgi:hypothetical protein
MRRGGAPPNMKIWLLKLPAAIGYHFLDDQLPLSLGSQMVDPLTTDRFFLCKSQGPPKFAPSPFYFQSKE